MSTTPSTPRTESEVFQGFALHALVVAYPEEIEAADVCGMLQGSDAERRPISEDDAIARGLEVLDGIRQALRALEAADLATRGRSGWTASPIAVRAHHLMSAF